MTAKTGLSAVGIAASLLMPFACFGTVSSCASSSPGTMLNTFATPADGCAEIDDSFNNFSLSYSGCLSPTSDTVLLPDDIANIALSNSFTITADPGAGNSNDVSQIMNSFSGVAAPEPSTGGLIAIGLICIGWFGRRRCIR